MDTAIQLWNYLLTSERKTTKSNKRKIKVQEVLIYQKKRATRKILWMENHLVGIESNAHHPHLPPSKFTDCSVSSSCIFISLSLFFLLIFIFFLYVQKLHRLMMMIKKRKTFVYFSNFHASPMAIITIIASKYSVNKQISMVDCVKRLRWQSFSPLTQLYCVNNNQMHDNCVYKNLSSSFIIYLPNQCYPEIHDKNSHMLKSIDYLDHFN